MVGLSESKCSPVTCLPFLYPVDRAANLSEPLAAQTAGLSGSTCSSVVCLPFLHPTNRTVKLVRTTRAVDNQPASQRMLAYVLLAAGALLTLPHSDKGVWGLAPWLPSPALCRTRLQERCNLPKLLTLLCPIGRAAKPTKIARAAASQLFREHMLAPAESNTRLLGW